jgi:hypothetical protein
MVIGVLSLRVKRGQGLLLTTYSLLVLRSRKSRNYTSSPHKCLHGVCWDHFTLHWRYEISNKADQKIKISRVENQQKMQVFSKQVSERVKSRVNEQTEFSKQKHDRHA